MFCQTDLHLHLQRKKNSLMVLGFPLWGNRANNVVSVSTSVSCFLHIVEHKDYLFYNTPLNATK